MFKSYITVAVRNFWKDRNYALVNLFGLAIGFACVLMIIAYVRFELSYDTSYSNSSRIYRLLLVNHSGEARGESVFTPSPLAKTLTEEFPEIESFTSLSGDGIAVLNKNHTPVSLPAITANANFFTVFNLPFVYGNPEALSKIHNPIVLTETTASKFFGDSNPVGKSFTDTRNQTYIIGGVIKDLPHNLHFYAEAIILVPVTKEVLSWQSYYSMPQYILCKKKASVAALTGKLIAFNKRHNTPSQFSLSLQPVQSIHLYSHTSDDMFQNSDIRYVYIFSAIALLILFIACINYINLTTARSLQRTREVGVRKVLGAERKQLVFQFLSESLLLFVIAFPMALIIAKLSWPTFSSLLQLQDAHIDVVNPASLATLAGATLLTGILSGLYPAVFLSALRPVAVLGGWRKTFNLNFGLRKVLIVAQFTVSVVLIIATIVVNKQLQLINELNLGFNKENLLILPYLSNKEALSPFKNKLLQNNAISSVSYASVRIGDGYGGSSSMQDESDSSKQWNFSFISGDFDLIKALQIPLLEGRSFSPDYSFDDFDANKAADSIKEKRKLQEGEWKQLASSRSIIITRKTAELIHLQKPYTGKIISLTALQGTVIGVIDDFKGISLREKNPAIVMRVNSNSWGVPYVRIRPGNISTTLSYIEKAWKQFIPDQSFSFTFADDKIQSLYASEQRLAFFFGIFATLGIVISCLGLFSLVALMVQQRTKEIGIRKVLGAGIRQIVQLISSDFLKLVIIGIAIASPIAWWTMNKWLQDYESRIDISWRIFATAGSAALLIAVVTISVQAIKAATANPVKSLRTE